MDEKTEIRETLAKSSLFGGISPEALSAVSEIASAQTVPKDVSLGHMGDPGKYCCIIISGRVRLFRPDQSGNEHDLGELGPGESFGEFNLLSHEPIPASVKTIEETRLIFLSREQFDPIAKRYPELTEAVGKGFSRWLQRAGSIIESQNKLQNEQPRFRWLDFVPIFFISILFGIAFNVTNPKGIPFFQKNFVDPSVTYVSPSDIYEKYKKGEVVIIDALPSVFYDQAHIKKALNLPLSTFDFMYELRLGKMDKSKEIIVYGRTISEHYDEQVAEKLVLRGFQNIRILRGGLSAWKKMLYPVEP